MLLLMDSESDTCITIFPTQVSVSIMMLELGPLGRFNPTLQISHRCCCICADIHIHLPFEKVPLLKLKKQIFKFKFKNVQINCLSLETRGIK